MAITQEISAVHMDRYIYRNMAWLTTDLFFEVSAKPKIKGGGINPASHNYTPRVHYYVLAIN